MNCKGCNKEIIGNEYKKVADWVFCLDCFDKLMNPPEPESGQNNHDLRESDSEKCCGDFSDKDQADKRQKCKICENEIEPGKEKKLGIWVLCESCYNDMTFAPDRKDSGIGSAQGDENDRHNEDSASDDDTEANSDNNDNTERINTGKTILCADCGRIILEIAAKKDGDDLLCPDCFYKRPQL